MKILKNINIKKIVMTIALVLGVLYIFNFFGYHMNGFYGNHFGRGFVPWMPMHFIWILILFLIFFPYKEKTEKESSPDYILKERFAKGEIDIDELKKRLNNLSELK